MDIPRNFETGHRELSELKQRYKLQYNQKLHNRTKNSLRTKAMICVENRKVKREHC